MPIVQFRIRHESSQEEAGLLRKVSCEVGCMAIDREAKVLATAALGETLWLKGFVDQKSRSSSQLVFHVTHLEFKKSN